MELMAIEFASKKRRSSNHADTVLKPKKMFFLCIQSKKMSIFYAILCTLLATTVAVLTVYFTAPKPSENCELTFQRTMKSSLTFSSQPRAVTTGHINNDKRIDFIVANYGTNTIEVFISQRNGTFINQQTYSTGSGSHPCSLAINDFNNDSYADLVVTNYGTNNIGLFIGYGNGTFHGQKIISLGSSHPLFVITTDFNNDNQIDIAVVNDATNTISVLLGYGNGSFQDQVTYFTGYDSFPCSLAFGDFNNDTYLDMVVANSGTNNIGIFLNYGNGTFANQHIYTTMHNSKPSSVAVEDLNNDNILDVIIANNGSRSVGIFYGYGNGTFTAQVSYRIGTNTYPQYITASDINKDNAFDIVVIDSENAQIHVLPGYENGSFVTVVTYDGVSGSMPVWISVADFNHNNQLDVVAVNYGDNNALVLMDYFAEPSSRQRNYHGGESDMLYSVAVSDFNDDSILDIAFGAANYIGILIGLGNSTFDKQTTYTISNESRIHYICTQDINNDNRMDIIIVDQGLDAVDVFLGHENGNFDTIKSYSTGVGSDPWWVAVSDLNNDTILDMITANYGSSSIAVLLGYKNATFALTKTYSITTPRSLAVTEINNDDYLDVIVAAGNHEIFIYLGQGDCNFITLVSYDTGVGAINPLSLSLADFNKDNQLDIVIANTFGDNIGVLLGYGDGTFASQTTYSTGSASQPYYVIVADCNNDNISDIIATLYGSNEVVILYGYGNGSFELRRRYSTGFASKPYGIVTTDLNNDTHLEFVVALLGTGDVAILTEYQAAQFVNSIEYSTGSSPQPTSVAIADFDNDSQSDLVLANSGKDSLGIILASSNGTFGSEVQYFMGTNFHPQYVITCDVNRDHHIDIVSVNSKNNSVSVIMGYGNGSFQEQIIYPTGDKSYPNAVVAGDINNDNRVDLVVANSGTHSIGIFYGYDYTSFQPQQTYSSINDLAPRTIITNDFNNDNILDIIIAFYDSNSWYVLLGYVNGSFTLVNTYSQPTDSSPRALGVGDFNNDNQVDVVIANEGSYNIGVYLGYGNGSFSSSTLYSTENGSRPIAVDVGDFNNDSRLDIVVANYGSENVGVFLGYGNGSFTAIVTYSTGQGSLAHAITVGDFNNDDRLDIAVANYGTHNVGILLGYGNGTFANQVTFSSGFGTSAVAITVGDFNKDNYLDIATANFGGNNVGILLGYGNGSFHPVVTYLTGDGSEPRGVSVGDFNNDNVSDIAVANYGTNNIVVLFGFGDGSFLLGSPYTTGDASLPYALVSGDFNADGRRDVAVANQKSSTVGIFLADDSQPFAGVTTYSIADGSRPHSVALGHFNNDSWLDIAIANYGDDHVGILLGLDGKDFQNIQTYSTGNGSAPYSIGVSDFDNDTHLDIVVTNSETNNIIILLGDGTGQFRNGATHSTGTQSRPYQVSIADFNNDNISDIAIANSGTSSVLLLYGYGNGTFGNDTLYDFGYGYRPYSIAAGQLNEDAWVDIAIACYGSDHVETLIKMC